MWAGGRFSFEAPLTLGQAATRRSTIQSVREKTGASGRLCFVTVQHRFSMGEGPAFTEEHDIVYREHPVPGATAPTPPPAPDGAEVTRRMTVGLPLLFRYSALTFNSHRIHYDIDYCRDIEGYPGCVVHGPLIASLLAGLAVELIGPLKSFSFRATAPLFHDQPFTLNAATSQPQGLRLWATTACGGQAMLAEASGTR